MAKFVRGKSGNVKGRPRGTRDKRTALRALLVPHAPKLIRKIVALALAGDVGALRLCLDRLVSPLKSADNPVSLGRFTGTLAHQARAVLAAMATGRITPDEASAITAALSAQARITETDELEKRITALEATK